MVNPTGETTNAGYAREDETTKRLWRTQIRKADPWEHRNGQQEEHEQEAPAEAPTAQAPAGKKRRNMISQTDKLVLQNDDEEPENPFESLLKHRL